MKRCAPEAAPDMPEQLLFTVKECQLAASAVRNEVMARVMGTDHFRADQVVKAIVQTGEFQTTMHDVLLDLQSADVLASKLDTASEESVHMTPHDIQHLGAALFYTGNMGVARAYAAAVHEAGFFITRKEKEHALSMITGITPRAFRLFKALTPIALTKQPALEWPEWREPNQYVDQLREQELHSALIRRIVPKQMLRP